MLQAKLIQLHCDTKIALCACLLCEPIDYITRTFHSAVKLVASSAAPCILPIRAFVFKYFI